MVHYSWYDRSPVKMCLEEIFNSQFSPFIQCGLQLR